MMVMVTFVVFVLNFCLCCATFTYWPCSTFSPKTLINKHFFCSPSGGTPWLVTGEAPYEHIHKCLHKWVSEYRIPVMRFLMWRVLRSKAAHSQHTAHSEPRWLNSFGNVESQTEHLTCNRPPRLPSCSRTCCTTWNTVEMQAWKHLFN